MLEILLAFCVVIALDHATKALAARTQGNKLRLVRPLPALRVASSLPMLFLLWAVIASLVSLLLAVTGALASPVLCAALGTVLGGSLSNALDQAARGTVIDFIDLRIWPVFNLADVAIVVGTSVLVWGVA